MLTALGVHLIRSGKVDAVLHVKASTVDPVQTDAWISTTVAEVSRAPSRATDRRHRWSMSIACWPRASASR